jgi:hypothetical protein
MFVGGQVLGTPETDQPLTPRAALVDKDFGRLPLYFIENRGQTNPGVA